MRTARDIYAACNIMPSLQLHQLRVAAVAKLICESFDPPAGGPVKINDVVLACLFHDMGNIIKSDLTKFPEFRSERGLEYWENEKKEFINRYGNNAHTANVAIAKEIGLRNKVVALIDGVGFSRLADILASDSYGLKIVEYADTRVGPHGVLSIKDRLYEAKNRYDARQKRKSYYDTDENFERLAAVAHKLEEQILAGARIRTEDINDVAVAPLIKELRTYPVA